MACRGDGGDCKAIIKQRVERTSWENGRRSSKVRASALNELNVQKHNCMGCTLCSHSYTNIFHTCHLLQFKPIEEHIPIQYEKNLLPVCNIQRAGKEGHIGLMWRLFWPCTVRKLGWNLCSLYSDILEMKYWFLLAIHLGEGCILAFTTALMFTKTWVGVNIRLWSVENTFWK